MLITKMFGESLKARGFDFYSGVPCSHLQYLINYAINECDFIMSANEGDAIATCAGAYLGGRKTVFLCQNSGLGNAVSPLTSLNSIFHIPVLGLVSLRGEPGVSDEPQHQLMGKITTQLLDLMEIRWEFLTQDEKSLPAQIDRARDCICSRKSFFLVVKKNTFASEPLHEQPVEKPVAGHKIFKSRDDFFPKRLEVLQKLSESSDQNTVLLATTGKTGRELYELNDSPNNFYMVGSMGCVSSLGLGIALAQPKKNIIVIDGDGALLMRMGSLATNGYYRPNNLLHVLLDNNCHDSTGGQITVSANMNFIELAASAGYKNAFYAHDISDLEKFIRSWKTHNGLTFVYMKIAKGSKSILGRPNLSPHQVGERLMKFILEHHDV